MIKRILVPLDGTNLAERALPYAIALANQFKATLLLKRVVQVNSLLNGRIVSGDSMDEAQLAALADSDIYLKYTKKCITEPEHPLHLAEEAVETITSYGKVVENLTEQLKLEKTDLIVMTTHGRNSLSELLLGSTAAGVVQHSSVPVMLIQPNQHLSYGNKEVDLEMLLDHPDKVSLVRDAERKCIVVALDGREYAEKALEAAIELAIAFEANLYLLEVIAPPSAISYGLGYGEFIEETRKATALELNTSAYQYLLKVQDRLQAQGLRSVKIVRAGDPATEIASYTDTAHALCLVMATHAPGRLGRALLGSTAHDVLRRTQLPVVLVHPPTVTPAVTLSTSDERNEGELLS